MVETEGEGEATPSTLQNPATHHMDHAQQHLVCTQAPSIRPATKEVLFQLTLLLRAYHPDEGWMSSGSSQDEDECMMRSADS